MVRRIDTAERLHALDPFDDQPASSIGCWSCEFTDRAIVLGSRQNRSVLDAAACAAAGLDIVKRRSGGGAVVLRPRDVIWIDLVVRTGTRGVPDDVRGSMMWAGERWRAVLAPMFGDRLRVHDGAMSVTPWSELVCFAGLGPGEVVVDGRKLVGLSQRRTRRGLRIQGLVHRHFRDDVDLFASPRPAGFPRDIATLPATSSSDDLLGALASTC